MAKVKPKEKHKKDEVFCDPGVCDNCQYICEGDFLCDEFEEIVISDWKPTANYMMCRRRRKRAGVNGN